MMLPEKDSLHAESPSTVLVVRRLIRASPERLFAVWTKPEYLMRWWGPAEVTCPSAEIDLCIGGGYRIANRFPDGSIVWIAGIFSIVDPPRRLVYSWIIEGVGNTEEQVTILFKPEGEATEVVILHERIADEATKIRHEAGWLGCLDKLSTFITAD